MENNNNKVNVIGEVVTDFEYSFQSHGEKFYSFEVAAMRKSGCADSIPVIVSERLVDVSKTLKGQYVCIGGDFRSHNKRDGEKSKLILSVFAKECELLEAVVTGEVCNEIELTGFICKPSNYRRTPFGREIADVLVAVNRAYGKSDYIPCIFWGRSAKYIATFPVGTKLNLKGRIQSREYVKKLEDNNTEKRTAYEVSVVNFDLGDEANEE